MPRKSGLTLLVMLLPLLGACAGGLPELGTSTGNGSVAQGERLVKARMLLRTDPAQAAQLLSATVASSPHDPVALGDLGIALDLLGKHADAQAAYRRALAAKPDLRAARVNLALSLALDGHPDGALETIALLSTTATSSPAEVADVAAVHALAGR